MSLRVLKCPGIVLECLGRVPESLGEFQKASDKNKSFVEAHKISLLSSVWLASGLWTLCLLWHLDLLSPAQHCPQSHYQPTNPQTNTRNQKPSTQHLKDILTQLLQPQNKQLFRSRSHDRQMYVCRSRRCIHCHAKTLGYCLVIHSNLNSNS